jgi:hypothetical protein
MIMIKPSRAALVATSLLLSSATLAVPCGGFTDVDSTAFNAETCQSVEWAKNRGITTGCTSTTLFCPNNVVFRSQMALFLNRLAKQVEPQILYTQETALPGTNFTGVRPSCIVGPVATSFPRAATVTGWVLLHPSSAGHVVGTGAIYSTDGGATWNGVGGGDYFTAANTSPSEFRQLPVSSASQAMEVGQSVLFALGIGLFLGTSGPSGGNTDCAITVRVDNRNPSTPPFDEAARPAGALGINLQR